MKTLGLDLSTTSTGWAYFEDTKLVDFGAIKAEVPGLSKLMYPQAALRKCISLSEQLSNMVLALEPDVIVIEEINKGTARISQKTLDGLHFIVLYYLDAVNYSLNKVFYIDSDGNSGWRSAAKLNLRLSQKDKEFNKLVKAENKKTNKLNKLVKPEFKIRPQSEITKKTLACNLANKLFNLNLSNIERKSDEDIADAILLTHAFIKFELKL